MSKEDMIRAMFSTASRFVSCLAAIVVCSVSFSGWAEKFEETKALAEQELGAYAAQV
ncbi:hypothetical protein F7C95_05580 [Opitutia bacterium ISCC 51]|nr:hypothetical protein F7C95_05580 [Opitutae bacterium ISCC 51]